MAADGALAAAGGPVRIGCCVDERSVGNLSRQDFDYAEVTLSLLEGARQRGEGVGELARSLAPPAEVVMGMFPRGTELLRIDAGAALDRARFVLDLVAEAGAGLAVLGAGAARSIPADMPREPALERLAALLAAIADEAAARGLGFAVENIGRGGSNVFNSLAETAGFLERFGLGRVGIAYDALQAALEGEPWALLARHGGRVAHVHLPDPLEALGGPEALPQVLSALARAGYAGRISVEPAELAAGPGSARIARLLRAALQPREPSLERAVL